MNWNKTQRTTFVDGWVWGALYGKRAGCESGLSLLEEKARLPSDSGNRCFGQFPKSLTTEILTKQVTAYYLRYPANPAHPGAEVSDVLEGIMEGKTFAEIKVRN